MKILQYNWIQFDNQEQMGGGVNVYQNNLIDALINSSEHDVYFLSGGWYYNAFKFKPYIERTENKYDNACQSFQIVNSPIPAPAYIINRNPDRFVDDKESVQIFESFIHRHGPFDVIHFNNFEGISINVLKLKEKFPHTKFIVSIHNYSLICPTAQYFQYHTQRICSDYHHGNDCLNCIIYVADKKEIYRRNKKYLFAKKKRGFLHKCFRFLSRNALKILVGSGKRMLGSKSTMAPEKYVRYRTHNVEVLSKYADVILAVSSRVRDIMIEHGCPPDKVKTSYIGTKFAESELRHSVAKSTQPFTIAYLGYRRVDKGFFFLMDALAKLPETVACKVNVVLCVQGIWREDTEKLKHFHHVTVQNGYVHSELKNILKDINLGIIPVIWEDNLPQVAIEMVANGVPILASSFGGATELCKSDLFKFQGGDEEDFLKKLQAIIEQPDLLQEYWNHHHGLVTMEQHIHELLHYYGA